MTGTEVNSHLRALHDDLKSLVLTCSANFPKEAAGGLDFLVEIVDLQAVIAAYERGLLLRLFESLGNADRGSVLRRANVFLDLLGQAATLPREDRSPIEIDAAIRRRSAQLVEATLLLDSKALGALSEDEDIPEMLYYLNTLSCDLCWYVGRYLARLNGELDVIPD